MNDITIRFAGPGDSEALAAMIDAQDRYRGSQRPAGEARSAVEGWLRDGAGGTRFVLALAGDQPVGFASFAVLYPGRALSGMLFLKDVFVVAERRSQGIGEEVMLFLAEYCAAQGIERIDWLVKTARSQHFYERLGATLQTRKRAMRLDGKALADLAER
jgi:GNAT superfamily N-acetyltransferase